MQTESDTSSFKLEGLITEKSFFPGEMPVASEGNFLLKNTSSKPVAVHIREVFFLENAEMQKIKNFSIYSSDRELENPFTVDADATLRFRITYPFRNIKINSKQKYHVYLKTEFNEEIYEAKSELIFVIETNKSF